MGQFFKFLFASCLGVILATVIIGGIGGMIMYGIASSADQPKVVKPNTVLKISLKKAIPEKTNNLEMDPFDFKNKKVLGLQEIRQTLQQAKSDDNIKGIYLELTSLSAGLATSKILRDAILDFKEDGKFVIAYSKYYTQGAYYMASAADKVYINPGGILDFRGLATQIPFYKEMLDNIGVKMQVYYAGQFKSATEPFRLKKMSEQNRMQVREYLDELYSIFLTDISDSRNIPVNELMKIADGYLANRPEAAKELNMVDDVLYEDQVGQEIRSLLGYEEDKKFPTISLESYNQSNPLLKDYSVKSKIAVIYAEGTIVDGKGEPGSVGDYKYMEFINKVRKDDGVKAVVLRVNSPGGSAMSSENIWRELTRLKETGKPLVVSMGDYAASGGYYISCIADTILAQSNTLTGSIGVFSILPNVQEMMDEKIGINYDTVKTGDFSTAFGLYYPVTDAQGKVFQARTDDLYETFLKRVADGRGLSRDEVHAVAQGRVWTGRKATEIGLVDRLGNLEDAIAIAADLAGLEDYRLTELPIAKDPLQQFIEILTEEEVRAKQLMKLQLGEYYPVYKQIEEIQSSQGVQARMPYILEFN